MLKLEIQVLFPLSQMSALTMLFKGELVKKAPVIMCHQQHYATAVVP